MTKPDFQLNQQIEEMRARLTENAQNEQVLLRALAEALGQVDQQLLTEVRQVTAAHEERRSNILGELQVLASRLCVFSKPLGSDHFRPREQVTSLNSMPGKISPRHAPGDWRQAASNIDDELDFYLDARAPTN
ncbi:MAG: hypothetical protein ABL894_02700 [Hyphomicrobium sp.]